MLLTGRCPNLKVGAVSTAGLVGWSHAYHDRMMILHLPLVEVE